MKWILKNEQGFTLFETLVSLLISSLILLLLTGGILQIVAIRDTITSHAQESARAHVISGDRQVEWHIFLNQLESYLRGTYDPKVFGDYLQVKEEVDTATGYRIVIYKQDSNALNFSRSADNGNQRMLTGIDRIAFSRNDGWLLVDVSFVNSDRYNGRIWTESWVEKEDIEEEIEDVEEDKELTDEVSEEEGVEDAGSENDRSEEKATEDETAEDEISEEEIIEDEEKSEEE